MFSILKKMVDRSEIENLMENIIFESEEGYELYNEYTITKHDSGYLVNKRNVHLDQWFFGMRNAVMWITFDKRNQIVEAKDVLSLDQKLAGAVFSMNYYSQLGNKTKDIDKKSLYVSKYNEGSEKKRQVIEKLNDYAIETKRWQNRRFAEAIK